ncbi:MAG: cytochrome c1 [Rhodospirillales bacterium]|nr:cytochrome c1 [Rhodospirillales bacterium]
MRRIALSAMVALALGAGPAAAAETTPLPEQDWSFAGLFGHFEEPALKRGFAVYNQVCASCHGVNGLAYRNLAGIGLDENQIAEIAAEKEVEDGPNDEGDLYMRPARAADFIVPPFANEQAARAANNGAYPPDLTLIVKARKGGADYLYGLLTGYLEEPPAGVTLGEGMYYNAYFPGHQIAMPPPISEGGVDFEDGTPATVEQMAHDVTTFLAWAASPELEARKRLGLKVLIFLVVLTGMLYALKRQVWSKLH